MHKGLRIAKHTSDDVLLCRLVHSAGPTNFDGHIAVLVCCVVLQGTDNVWVRVPVYTRASAPCVVLPCCIAVTVSSARFTRRVVHCRGHGWSLDRGVEVLSSGQLFGCLGLVVGVRAQRALQRKRVIAQIEQA